MLVGPFTSPSVWVGLGGGGIGQQGQSCEEMLRVDQGYSMQTYHTLSSLLRCGLLQQHRRMGDVIGVVVRQLQESWFKGIRANSPFHSLRFVTITEPTPPSVLLALQREPQRV